MAFISTAISFLKGQFLAVTRPHSQETRIYSGQTLESSSLKGGWAAMRTTLRHWKSIIFSLVAKAVAVLDKTLQGSFSTWSYHSYSETSISRSKYQREDLTTTHPSSGRCSVAPRLNSYLDTVKIHRQVVDELTSEMKWCFAPFLLHW